jgi:hypothetical protein
MEINTKIEKLNKLVESIAIIEVIDESIVHFKWRNKYYLLDFSTNIVHNSTEYAAILLGSGNDAILFTLLMEKYFGNELNN